VKAIYGGTDSVMPGGRADHAACDAQIAALRQMAGAGELLARHLSAVTDALNVALSNTVYNALKLRYVEALRDLEPLAGPGGIAKYDQADHNETSEIRHVRSSDSAASGDEIPG
jgi:hypothetical protein